MPEIYKYTRYFPDGSSVSIAQADVKTDYLPLKDSHPLKFEYLQTMGLDTRLQYMLLVRVFHQGTEVVHGFFDLLDDSVKAPGVITFKNGTFDPEQFENSSIPNRVHDLAQLLRTKDITALQFLMWFSKESLQI